MKSAKKYDIGDLKRMTPEPRAALYENARRRLTEGGKEVIDLLDSSGLPLCAGGMTTSDPTYLRMEEIVWSVAGRKAAIVATEEGPPPLAGVEPLSHCRAGRALPPARWRHDERWLHRSRANETSGLC
jgi:hypothetical protein